MKSNGGTGLVMDTLIGPVVHRRLVELGRPLADLPGRRPHVPLTKGLQPRRPFVHGCAYFAGRTCTCMKLPWALIERTSITVLVFGLRTPADGVAARQYCSRSSNVDTGGSPP